MQEQLVLHEAVFRLRYLTLVCVVSLVRWHAERLLFLVLENQLLVHSRSSGPVFSLLRFTLALCGQANGALVLRLVGICFLFFDSQLSLVSAFFLLSSLVDLVATWVLLFIVSPAGGHRQNTLIVIV